MDINQINPVLTQAYTNRSPVVLALPQTNEPPVSLATPPVSNTLNEVQSTAPVVASGSYPDVQSLVLKDDSGSGNLYIKVATAIYALNHSFDEQKAVLDLIA